MRPRNSLDVSAICAFARVPFQACANNDSGVAGINIILSYANFGSVRWRIKIQRPSNAEVHKYIELQWFLRTLATDIDKIST